MDVSDVNVLLGKRIKLTLKTSSFLGVVQRINPNKTLILADVCGSNDCKYPGTKMFFGREVLNVEFVNERESGCGDTRQQRAEERLDVEKFQPYMKTITLDNEDDEECINLEVVDEFHEKFGSAVMHIKKQNVIGVGVEVFRNGRLFWLQIATKTKVYLFDILLLGAQAFKNGLSMILENKHILKVIHDCRSVAGCLRSQFGVKLTNVFDTQVADIMCFQSRTGGLLPDRVSTLPEVVSLYLEVPSSQLLSLQMTSQFTKEEREIWYKRPCPVPLQKVMTLSVIHLEPLRLVLLDTLMKDYMMLVDSYLNSSLYNPDELDHINMESVLELPREFRQLDQLYLERQKRAKDTYPVTEQGLLSRFHPPTHGPAGRAEERCQKKEDDCETVAAPPQADPLLHKSPPSPPRILSGSSGDVAADSSTVSAKDSGPCQGVGRGVMMKTMGRGRLFGKAPLPGPPALDGDLHVSPDPNESPGGSW